MGSELVEGHECGREEGERVEEQSARREEKTRAASNGGRGKVYGSEDNGEEEGKGSPYPRSMAWGYQVGVSGVEASLTEKAWARAARSDNETGSSYRGRLTASSTERQARRRFLKVIRIRQRQEKPWQCPSTRRRMALFITFLLLPFYKRYLFKNSRSAMEGSLIVLIGRV